VSWSSYYPSLTTRMIDCISDNCFAVEVKKDRWHSGSSHHMLLVASSYR
jgi:hypothetical protein